MPTKKDAESQMWSTHQETVRKQKKKSDIDLAIQNSSTTEEQMQTS